MLTMSRHGVTLSSATLPLEPSNVPFGIWLIVGICALMSLALIWAGWSLIRRDNGKPARLSDVVLLFVGIALALLGLLIGTCTASVPFWDEPF